MLLSAVRAFGQGEIPAEKQATNVGNWTSVTVTPAQTLKTTWNFESFYATCGPGLPSQVSIIAEGVVPQGAFLVQIPKLGVAYYGNYRFLVWAGYRASQGLSEAEFGLWDQYASVLTRAEGDVYLAPWHAGSAAVIGYLDNAQNPALAQAMVNVLLAGNPKNEMAIDIELLPEAGFPDHSFTFGGQGSALDAGSAIQAAVANADGSCVAYGEVGKVLWIH
jgi:hypothetical protein